MHDKTRPLMETRIRKLALKSASSSLERTRGLWVVCGLYRRILKLCHWREHGNVKMSNVVTGLSLIVFRVTILGRNKYAIDALRCFRHVCKCCLVFFFFVGYQSECKGHVIKLAGECKGIPFFSIRSLSLCSKS